MRTLFLIAFVTILTSCIDTDSNRRIFIPELGWKFEVPNKISFDDSAFNKNGQLVEGIPANGPSLRLMSTKSDKGSFAAYIRKDTLDAKGWTTRLDEDTEWYFNQMRELPQIIILDTKYSTEKVDNINFLFQHVKYIRKSTKDTGYTYHYFGKLKDKELDISFEYYDEEVGKIYRRILKSSSFSN